MTLSKVAATDRDTISVVSRDDEGADALLPATFGRYTLVERLATGGMAEVFKAKILSAHGFEKQLVIKRILPNLAADKNFVAMFIDEAKLTVQLDHPKIIQVTDFGEVDGQYFIALEYIDGFDALALLRASANTQVRIPVPISVFIVMEVLDALDYAHNAVDVRGNEMKLVHRDISPSNIFISRRGDVKLADFGIAHAQERESKTQAGTLKGKYGYMSPEQVTGQPLDGRSDLFAVGIVLAEMLMGRRLFSGGTELEVLLMVRDGRLERLDKYCTDIPDDLDRIVRKSLRRSAEDRYPTAAAFRDALAELLFRWGCRLGPRDVGAVFRHYFDETPGSAERLQAFAQSFPVPRTDAPFKSRIPTDAPETAADGDSINTVATIRAALENEELDVVVDTDVGAVPHNSNPVPGTEPVSLVEIDQDAETPVPAVQDTGPYPYPVPPNAGYGALPGALPAGANSGSSGAIVAGGAFGTPFSGAAASGGDVELNAPTTDLGQELDTSVRPPDTGGDLSIISPMRIFADLAITKETGLLRLEIAPHVKEIYIVRGAPESVNSSLKGERFGEYLVSRGFLSQQNLDLALAQLPRYSGKLGDTLVGLGLMRPLDVFRLLSQQVRERVIEIFSWVQGYYAFYRNVRNPTEAFPLNLDTFEIMGAGLPMLPYEFLDRRFAPFLDYRPRANNYAQLQPEAFRLGPTPRDVLNVLDGSQTLRAWVARFTNQDERLTFLRTLYLLVETDLAQFA